MSQTQWGSLKVHDFFSHYNWTGETPQLDSLDINQDAVKPSSLLCLKIGDFLQRANWTGQSSQRRSHPSPSTTTSILSVTMSVNEFFDGINWGSNQTIPLVSSVSSNSPPVPASSKPLNVNNLSNLF